jgi:putative ABC transport system permease protein
MQAALMVDSERVDSVQERLLTLPAVLTSTRKSLLIAEARTQQQEGVGRFAVVLTLFAMAIASAVIYNGARVALSARQRELSTLRVLGFTPGEVSRVLGAELTVQIALALPVGLLLGTAIVHGISAGIDPELFRFPTTISARTHAISVLSIVSSAAISMLFVRAQVNKLDLVEALKSRE